MEDVMQLLFNYLKNILYDPDNASLDVDSLPDDVKEFANGLVFFSNFVLEAKHLAMALSRGELNAIFASRGNEIAAPLKSLHASLRHLSWQAQRIAQGDYNQRVSFMGDFSEAFNSMVLQLAERERALEEKVIQVEEKSHELEQGNRFLTALIHYVPQQIFVVSNKTNEILISNDVASEEIKRNKNHLNDIIMLANVADYEDESFETEITYELGGSLRYLHVSRFSLAWTNEKANVYIVDDITEAKNELANLEASAYIDTMTQLNNRAFGMMTLDMWLSVNKAFALIFIDLDNLKFLNDKYGHAEGDIFITRSAKELAKFSKDSVACRIGGDEFMILAPGYGFDEADKRMAEINDHLKTYRHSCDKEFRYNLSYGIAAVDENNYMMAGDILHVADLRMYDHKQRNKRMSKTIIPKATPPENKKPKTK